jgi:hypothetical protein
VRPAFFFANVAIDIANCRYVDVCPRFNGNYFALIVHADTGAAMISLEAPREGVSRGHHSRPDCHRPVVSKSVGFRCISRQDEFPKLRIRIAPIRGHPMRLAYVETCHLVTSRERHHTLDCSLPVSQGRHKRIVDEAFELQFVGAPVVVRAVVGDERILPRGSPDAVDCK